MLLRTKEDARGSLIAIEGGHDVPFAIERVYYIFGTADGVEHGFHAYRELRQWVVCLSGSCTVLVDNGREREAVRLDSPATVLELQPLMWYGMHDFSQDAVLLVLASALHDESELIRDYEIFLKLTSGD